MAPSRRFVPLAVVLVPVLIVVPRGPIAAQGPSPEPVLRTVTVGAWELRLRPERGAGEAEVARRAAGFELRGFQGEVKREAPPGESPVAVGLESGDDGSATLWLHNASDAQLVVVGLHPACSRFARGCVDPEALRPRFVLGLREAAPWLRVEPAEVPEGEAGLRLIVEVEDLGRRASRLTRRAVSPAPPEP